MAIDGHMHGILISQIQFDQETPPETPTSHNFDVVYTQYHKGHRFSHEVEDVQRVDGGEQGHNTVVHQQKSCWPAKEHGHGDREVPSLLYLKRIGCWPFASFHLLQQKTLHTH